MLSNNIKNEVIHLAKSSTAYVVPHLLNSQRLFNRIFWIIFLVTSMGLSCFYVYSGITEFLQFNVVTNIKTEYDQPTEFPTVTFCSWTQNFFNDHVLTEIIHSDSRFGYEKVDTESIKNSFELFTSQSYGRCYRFNSGINMMNQSVPVKNSIIGGRDDSLYLKFTSAIQLIVWVHNRTQPPTIEDWNNHDSPIKIEKGYTDFIAVEKTVSLKLGSPYNECLKDTNQFNGNKTIVNKILSSDHSYTQVKCFELCFNLAYINSNPCNCTSTLGRNLKIKKIFFKILFI